MRQPPHNFEAEQAVLGSLMVDNGAYHRVADFLKAEHFSDPLHGRLFDAQARMIDRGQAVTPVTLKAHVDQDPDLLAAGGTAYMARLAMASVYAVDAEQYARLVLDAYQRRKLIEIAQAAIDDAHMMAEDAAGAQIEGLEQRLFDLAGSGAVKAEAKVFRDVVRDFVNSSEAAYRRGSAPTGISTGYIGLDAQLGGLHKSDLIILAGRPSMGKTALATNIAMNMAMAYREEIVAGKPTSTAGAGVGFFSLEMSAEQLVARIMADQTGLPLKRMKEGHFFALEFDKLLNVASAREYTPIVIDESATHTIAGLRARARRMKHRYGIGLLVVDYLQMLDGSNRRDGRVQEMSEITRGLKALAKDLDLPVLVLSQLSRQVEQRPDKRPQLSDLRDSGSIEQDADVVLFVFREEYYLERSSKKGSQAHLDAMGNAEIIIAKHRHGATGMVPMRFDGARTKFSDLDAA